MSVLDSPKKFVAGDVAHSAVDSGSPVKIGGKAASERPAAVTDADRADAWFDIYGRNHSVVVGELETTRILAADITSATYKPYGAADAGFYINNLHSGIPSSTDGTTRPNVDGRVWIPMGVSSVAAWNGCTIMLDFDAPSHDCLINVQSAVTTSTIKEYYSTLASVTIPAGQDTVLSFGPGEVGVNGVEATSVLAGRAHMPLDMAGWPSILLIINPSGSETDIVLNKIVVVRYP